MKNITLALCLIVATPALGLAAKKSKSTKPVESPPAVVAPEAVPAPIENAPAPSAFGQTYKIKLAVLDINAAALAPDLARSLTTTLAQTLDALGPFKSLPAAELVQLVKFNADQQLLGCDDPKCIHELGNAWGSDFLIAGSITSAGETHLLQLTLTNVAQAKIEARVSRDYVGDPMGLLAETRAAAKLLMRDILLARAGKLALSISEEGATVVVDGAIVGTSPIQDALTLPGGAHTLGIEKSGFITYRKDIAIEEDKSAQLDVMLLPSREFVLAYKERASFTRTLAWIGIGGGAALVAGSGVLFGVGKGQASKLNDDIASYNSQALRETASYERLSEREGDLATLNVLTTAVLTAGIGAACAGILTYFLADDPERYDNSLTVGVVP